MDINLLAMVGEMRAMAVLNYLLMRDYRASEVWLSSIIMLSGGRGRRAPCRGFSHFVSSLRVLCHSMPVLTSRAGSLGRQFDACPYFAI